MTKKRNNYIYYLIALLLPSIIIYGTRSFLNIRVAGLVLTPYRVCIPLIFLLLVGIEYKDRKKSAERRFKETCHLSYLEWLCIIIAIWMIYGLATIVLFKYSVTDIGLKELLVLGLSGMVIVIVNVLCERDCWDWIMVGVKIFVAASIIVGVYELITGLHLSTSRYSDPKFIEAAYGLVGVDSVSRHIATSFFYNENDFMAFLAIFSPVFAADMAEKPIANKITGSLGLGMIYYLIYSNDAFICLIAFLICVVLFIILSRPDRKTIALIIVTLVIARLAAYCSTDNMLEMSAVDQFENLDAGYGSMLFRINTYIVTLRETFFTSHGLGFGAGSFSNYFERFAETEKIMLNPHCFWLEIMAEYGVIIFTLFVGFLIALFIKQIKQLNDISIEKMKTVTVICMGTALIFASVAPSSYLQQTYYWIPIGMGVYLADLERQERR